MTERPRRGRLALLALTALGVVYGDIGTSPLYSIRECFRGEHAVPPTHANVLGVLSLIFWALVIVVTLKYQVYVLRADYHGEGGILALMALARRALGSGRRGAWLVPAMGLFGAALLYGDGMITPAISVLSAVEGLEVATPVFHRFVLPATIAILVGLFLFQRRGTAKVGAVFGPVMLLWFTTLGALGLAGILRHPAVLAAVDPSHAVRFFAANRGRGFLVLGAVFLVATGGEALYADMGHFGKAPIQIDWFSLVGVALLLNYFGQGALLIESPAAAVNPFYRLAPGCALPARRPLDRRHRHRLPGDHLGGLLAHQPGGPARLSAARRDRPHLGGGDRADLHPGDQLAPHAGDDRPRLGLPHLVASGRRLRRRGDDDDGRHHPPRLCRRPQGLGVEPLDRRPRHLGLPRRRPGVLRRQHGEGRRRRLVPAPRRRRRLGSHDHLAPRPRRPGRPARQDRPPHRDFRRRAPPRPPAAGGRGRRSTWPARRTRRRSPSSTI